MIVQTHRSVTQTGLPGLNCIILLVPEATYPHKHKAVFSVISWQSIQTVVEIFQSRHYCSCVHPERHKGVRGVVHDALSILLFDTSTGESSCTSHPRGTESGFLMLKFNDSVGVSCSQSAATAHGSAEQDTDHHQMIKSRSILNDSAKPWITFNTNGVFFYSPFLQYQLCMRSMIKV